MSVPVKADKYGRQCQWWLHSNPSRGYSDTVVVPSFVMMILEGVALQWNLQHAHLMNFDLVVKSPTRVTIKRTGPHRVRTGPEMTDHFASTTVTSKIKA